MKKILILFVVGIMMLMSSCAFTQGLPEDGTSCPDAPKCVSSYVSDPRHHIEPFNFNDELETAVLRLKQALLREKRVTIITEQATFLRAEVRSLIFRFVDDVEFTMLPDQGLIHVRSSARTGYSDFGVNRRRIERIRELFQE
ncbi:MAG: DUF1499 domain-containing protein [Gammaproteobacteria bacterium]|jgi:uncharacterized protein (DUF1499 family)